MKITSNPPLPAELGLNTVLGTSPGAESRAAGGAAVTTGPQPQVQLTADAAIRTLLNELTKLLAAQDSLWRQLPATVATAAGDAASQELTADEVLPQGLASLVRGAKTAPESLVAFAGRLEEAAALARTFPAGLPPALVEAAELFAAQVMEMAAADGPPPTQAAAPPAGQTVTTGSQTGQAATTGNPQPAAVANQAAGQPAVANQAAGQPAAATGSQAPAVMTTQAAVPTAQGGMLAGQTPAMTPATAAAIPGQAAAGSAPTVVMTAKDALTELVGQLTKPLTAETAAGNGTELERLAKVLTAILPDRPAPALRTALRQATTALTPYLPAEGELPAAVLPALRDGLVLAKVAESQLWLKLPETSLRTAAVTLRELATVALPGQPAAETAGSQQVLTMAVPLYFGPEARPYPAYIHISQERESDGQGRAPGTVRDTWLRVCLATENIGLVDIVFHMWGDRQLSIRAIFSEQAVVEDFRRLVPSIREELAASPLTLADISAVAPQGK